MSKGATSGGTTLKTSEPTFRVLGPDVQVAGERVTGLAGAMAAALLVADGHRLAGEELVSAMWSEDPPQDAVNNVRKQRPRIVRALRAAGLDSDILVAHGQGAYELLVEDNDIDYHRFLRLVDLGRSAEGASEFESALETYAEALRLPRSHHLTHLATLPADSDEWRPYLDRYNDAATQALEAYFDLATRVRANPADVAAGLTYVGYTSMNSPVLWRASVLATLRQDGHNAAQRVLTNARLHLGIYGLGDELDDLSRTLSDGSADESPPRGPHVRLPRFWPGDHSRDVAPTIDIELNSAEAARRIDLGRKRDSLLDRKVTGSNYLRVRDLVNHSDLRLPVHATFRTGMSRGAPIADAVDYLIACLLDEDHPGVIAIAPPGRGKSLTLCLVEIALIDSYLSGESDYAPTLIDLRSYRHEWTAANFGTDQWVEARIATRGRHVASTASEFVLDSLDELLASGSLNQVRDTVARPLFTRHSKVLACRSQFYDQFLRDSDATSTREVIELDAWNEPEIQAYIEAFHRRVFRVESTSFGGALSARVSHDDRIRALLANPLRLNMALDLITPEADFLPEQLNNLSLYKQFLTKTLQIEAQRAGSILEADEKLAVLKLVAWDTYDEGSPGVLHPPDFSQERIEELVASRYPERDLEELQRITRDITQRTVLVAAEASSPGAPPGSYSFEHKSFQEYLVAQNVRAAMEASPEATASVFRRHLSPEVSDFVKDEIALLVTRRTKVSAVVTNCQQALLSYDRELQSSSDTSGRARSAVQQLCYYLASIPHPAVHRAMKARLSSESDPWIRRAIAIGLNFGGISTAVDHYVDSLTLERSLGGECPANELNVGYHLSFFGDQPFDPVEPFVDQGQAQVDKTVSTLIRQLTTETDRGSWRVDLYTVIDICRHRPQSRQSAEAALRESVIDARRALEVMEGDAQAALWPEVHAFRELLREMGLLEEAPT
jgi:hypothetical protein